MAAEIGRTLQKAGIRYYSIGGPATAAAPIAAALSNWTWEQAALLRNQQVPDEWGVRRGPPAPWFLVRSSPKDHGTRQQIEGCVRGEGVILVDDVLTTGKSLIQAIDVLDREEYFVAGVFVLVARGSSAELEIRLESHQSRFGASDGEVFSLFDIEDILL